mgnify:CR=1 FL=1
MRSLRSGVSAAVLVAMWSSTAFGFSLFGSDKPEHAPKPAVQQTQPPADSQDEEGPATIAKTLAANLDSEYVNRIHDVSPMPASLNPIDDARRVGTIAQIHFSGANDEIVPTRVARRFVERAGPACAQVYVVPDMTHGGDWARAWPGLLAVKPVCLPR